MDFVWQLALTKAQEVPFSISHQTALLGAPVDKDAEHGVRRGVQLKVIRHLGQKF